MIGIDLNNLDARFREIENIIEADARKALKQTAYDVKDLVWKNLSKKRNAYNEPLDPEAKSTITRKGFSSPLRDTTRMQRGLVPNKITDDLYRIELTNKADIYAKYLNTRTDKNWHILVATDYIIKKAKQFFKKNYGK